MILLLRGHIRNSFTNNNLYDLICNVIRLFPDLHIYIHTWNIMQSNLSWRKINSNNTIVTQEHIIKYFKDKAHHIRHILIDDDTSIILKGNKTGNICRSLCPTVAWKNMWYGIHEIASYIAVHEPPNQTVINTRFDVLDNSNHVTRQQFLLFISQYQNISNNIVFIHTKNNFGVDNLYMGSINSIHTLAQHFNDNLDTIVLKYPTCINQEHLVFYEFRYLAKTNENVYSF